MPEHTSNRSSSSSSTLQALLLNIYSKPKAVDKSSRQGQDSGVTTQHTTQQQLE
jgi:hypothetical protein